MQALVHRWPKCTAIGGDYVNKMVFCSQEFALSNSVIVLFVSIVVSMEINRRHYFRSGLRTYIHVHKSARVRVRFAEAGVSES